MTSEMINDLIKIAMFIGGAVAAIYRVCEYFEKKDKNKMEYEIVKLRENSLGETALKSLKVDYDLVRKDVDKLDEKIEDKSEEINTLKKHLDQLGDKIWTFLTR